MLLAAILLPCVPAPGSQVDPFSKVVSCDYHRAEIRTVISDMLGKQGISFSCDRPIGGKVSLHLKSISFFDAFMCTLDSCYLTWRSGSGVIQIVHRDCSGEEHRRLNPNSPPAIQTFGLPSDRSDPLTARNEDAHEVLWRVLSKSGRSFVIGDGLDQKITATLPAQTLGETLGSILWACRGELSFKAGVWIIRGPCTTRP